MIPQPDDAVRAPAGTEPETVTLEDGTRLRLDFLGPGDRDDLLRGFEGLSPRSRYLRFFSRMPTLPPYVVDGLLRTDGRDRVAIGARLLDADGRLLPAVVGVARYFRADPGSTAAEPAVAVVDALHGRGLARALLRRLGRHARESGITRFRAHALIENARVRRMLRSAGATVVEHDGPLLIYDMALQPRRRAPGRLRRILGAMQGS